MTAVEIFLQRERRMPIDRCPLASRRRCDGTHLDSSDRDGDWRWRWRSRRVRSRHGHRRSHWPSRVMRATDEGLGHDRQIGVRRRRGRRVRGRDCGNIRCLERRASRCGCHEGCGHERLRCRWLCRKYALIDEVMNLGRRRYRLRRRRSMRHRQGSHEQAWRLGNRRHQGFCGPVSLDPQDHALRRP